MPEEKGATGSRSASPKAKTAHNMAKTQKAKTKTKTKAKTKTSKKTKAGGPKHDALGQKKGKRDLTREEFDAREAEVRKALLDAQFSLIQGKPKGSPARDAAKP